MQNQDHVRPFPEFLKTSFRNGTPSVTENLQTGWRREHSQIISIVKFTAVYLGEVNDMFNRRYLAALITAMVRERK